MSKILNNNGFGSLIEVIITSVIFVIATFGIISTVSMLKPKESDSSKKLEAAYVAKGVLDELRGSVDAASWNTVGSPLYCNGISSSTYYRTGTFSSGGTYNITYVV